MKNKHKFFISGLLICICIVGFVHGSDSIVDVMSLVEKTVTDPNVGWSPEWQREYIDAVRKALGENLDKPDYYQVAVTNLMNVERQRLQAKSQAYRMERQLERERSRQFLQTEQIGFLLAALVETAKQYPLKQPDSQSSFIRGGDVYDVSDILSKK